MHVGYYFGALFSFLVWKLGTLDILRVSGLMHIRYSFTHLLPIPLSGEFTIDSTTEYNTLWDEIDRRAD